MPVTRVAAYHSAPLSPQNNKAISLVHQASKSSASMIVSPESHINLPLWSALCTPTENHPLFHRMVQDSIYADGREIQLPPSSAAQDTKTTISIEISRSVYNSNLIIDLSGTVRRAPPKINENPLQEARLKLGWRTRTPCADTPHGRVIAQRSRFKSLLGLPCGR